jgi:large subunit ribosomal protein L15
MKVHELQVTATKRRVRVGRGISAGGGKTAGRGTKGQNSRTGGGVRIGFEGGQNKLAKRLPKKRGFRALNHKEFQVVNLGSLEQFASGTTVDMTLLLSSGLVKSATGLVKILGTGELTHKLTVQANAVSKTAASKITSSGGTIELQPVGASKKSPAAAQ